jgi:Protein of unknown function (DUF3592)
VIEHVRQYPVNGAVTAHYNPSNPADAVLEVHTTGFSSLIGVAIVLGIIGAGWWLGANWLSRQ